MNNDTPTLGVFSALVALTLAIGFITYKVCQFVYRVLK
jgi:hypothetical protein